MREQDFDVFVIGSHHRRPMTPDYISGKLKYELIMTPDVNLPIGWQPSSQCKHYVRPDMELWNRAYRCTYGHKMALQKSNSQHVLIIQDDCQPLRNDWIEILQQARKYLKDYEIVSLHVRKPDMSDFNIEKFGNYNQPLNINMAKNGPFKHRYCLGSLIYWIRRDQVQKHIDLASSFNGMPRDIEIASMGSFCFVSPSPFYHIEHGKSLIDIK